MPIISASLDAFLITAVLTLTPYIYFILHSPSPPTTATSPSSSTRLRAALTALVLAHTLFVLYNLVVCAPQNIFTSLRVPLTTPVDALRRVLLDFAGPGVQVLPQPLEVLLGRLSSFEVRTLYVRFGHTAVQECAHCRTYADFALFATPRPLLEFAREAAVLGLLTVRASGRARWRPWGLGALCAAAGLEAYWLATVEIKVPRDGRGVAMWHDRAWRLRQLLFLLLPIAAHHLPPAPSAAPTPLTALPSLTALMEHTLARIHALKYAHGAAARTPALREASGEWWARERREGAWGTQDADVQRLAGTLGLGIEEGGRLRTSARMAAETLQRAFAPSEHM